LDGGISAVLNGGRMRKYLLCLCAIFLTAVCALHADDTSSGQWTAILSAKEGTVEIMSADTEGQWAEADADMPLDDNDKIRTGENSSAEISFDGESVVRLDADTVFEITSTAHKDAKFRLKQGGLLARVKDIAKRARSWRMYTPSAVCSVRGTEFAVEYATATDETSAGVFDEGEIEVGPSESDRTTARSIQLKKRQEVTFRGMDRALVVSRMVRLNRHNDMVSALRMRLFEIKKNWREMPPEKKDKIRRAFFTRWQKIRGEEKKLKQDGRKLENSIDKRLKGRKQTAVQGKTANGRDKSTVKTARAAKIAARREQMRKRRELARQNRAKRRRQVQ